MNSQELDRYCSEKLFSVSCTDKVIKASLNDYDNTLQVALKSCNQFTQIVRSVKHLFNSAHDSTVETHGLHVLVKENDFVSYFNICWLT